MPSFYQWLISQNTRYLHVNAILHNFPFCNFDRLVFDPRAGHVFQRLICAFDTYGNGILKDIMGELAIITVTRAMAI
jgi:hypothetical protein